MKDSFYFNEAFNNHFPKHQWMGKFGELHNVVEMESSHIHNCINMLLRQINKCENEVPQMRRDRHSGPHNQLAYGNKHVEIATYRKWVDIFRDELKRREPPTCCCCCHLPKTPPPPPNWVGYVMPHSHYNPFEED